MSDISYMFYERKIPKDDFTELFRLGLMYEREIGGISDGFGSMITISANTLLIVDGQRVAGFLMSSKSTFDEPMFPEERMCYLSAAYLDPDYRTKAGVHQGVLKSALEKWIDEIERNGYDRIRVFPPDGFRQQLVTPVGHEKILRPLHEILEARQNPTGEYCGDTYNLTYLFRSEEYRSRAQGHNPTSS